MPAHEFNDRLAVITGASSGIGLALCERLLDTGARVLAFSRQGGGLPDLLERYPQRLHWLAGDVTRADDLRAWPGARQNWGRWTAWCPTPVSPSSPTVSTRAPSSASGR